MSVSIVNWELAKRGEAPLRVDANGKAHGLLAAAVRLGLTNSTPYLQALALAG
jgi:hypothetical protein